MIGFATLIILLPSWHHPLLCPLCVGTVTLSLENAPLIAGEIDEVDCVWLKDDEGEAANGGGAAKSRREI